MCRYLLFLKLHKEGERTMMCPTYDIDICWHTHMSSPHAYKAHTEALLARHHSHDDSINDRSPGAKLSTLQKTSEQRFQAAGHSFFRAGGMFRGTPPLLTPAQRAAALHSPARARLPLSVPPHCHCHCPVHGSALSVKSG